MRRFSLFQIFSKFSTLFCRTGVRLRVLSSQDFRRARDLFFFFRFGSAVILFETFCAQPSTRKYPCGLYGLPANAKLTREENIKLASRSSRPRKPRSSTTRRTSLLQAKPPKSAKTNKPRDTRGGVGEWVVAVAPLSRARTSRSKLLSRNRKTEGMHHLNRGISSNKLK